MSTNWISDIDYYLENTENVNTRTLKNYVKKFSESKTINEQIHKTALDTKLASTNAETNLLSSTMTRYQLFSENNPLWAKGLTITVIETILRTHNQIERPSQAKFFKEHFDEYCQNKDRLANALRLGTAFKTA